MDTIIDPAGLITDHDLKTLLAELKPDGSVQIHNPLGGSRKNPNQNTVFKICYLDHSGTPWSDGVVKIGPTDSLEKEFKNYSEYVTQGPLPPEYKVVLQNPKSIGDKAILPIDFVDLDNYQVFTNYYKENPAPVLETLLDKVLKPWHETGKPKYHDLKQYILSRMLHHRDDLIEECERLFPEFGGACGCLVQQLKRTLTNPVFLLQKEKLELKIGREFWTIESIIHGDLNFNNIFVEDTTHLKLIDYENTREDIVFNDLARLECEIKFIFLKHYDITSFWQGLLEFEKYVTDQLLINEDELPESAKEFEDIKKASRCISVIRKRANEIIQQNSRVKETAYWIELLIRTLKYVSYKSQDGFSQLTDSQKKYSLISALLLADNYLKDCETTSEQPMPITIFPGPHLEDDSVLSKLPQGGGIKDVDNQESEDLSLLQRAIIAGHTVLFLGPNAPKATKAPTKLELATALYKQYMGNDPNIKKPDLIFSLLTKSQDMKDQVYEDVYTTYKDIDLQGFYKFIPAIRWKRIYNEYVDFLVERSYEELKVKIKLQNYENRFSPKESRNDENLNIVVIERPYGSARFYNDPHRSPQLSAESITRGKALRIRWYNLIKDIRAPLSVLFYGFNWNDLKDLYFDISESIKISDENSSFFWLPEDRSEEDIIEAKSTGLKIIHYPLENLLEEITYMEKGKPKKDLGKGITISLKTGEIPLDQQVAENCAEYFEILHDGIEKTPGLDIGPFFEGEEVNWRELAANCDVYRSQIEESHFEDKIGKEINKDAPNKGFLLLAEYAGSGTTTIMKRLGFNIAKKGICPVVYLYRLDSNTWKLLEEFYQSCGDRKFLILIDNVSPQSDKFRELYGMLQSRRVNSVFLATARRDEWNQLMISYTQNSGEDIDVEEGRQSKIKRFKWITLKTVDDILNQKEKDLLLRNFVDFGVLTKNAASRFGKGYSNETLKYSNLLPLCWAATEGKNRKFELIVKEYYDDKIKLSERRIVDVVCAVNLFYSKGVTDRMIHRIINVTWDRLKLLLNSDSMQQLIMIKPDYYDGKQVYRVVPRNHGISEILLQPEASEFPQRVLTILTENLSIEEGEEVEEDLLFNIVRSKELHNYLADKSNKNKLFEFAHEQSPYDNRILQHWGMMLYDHAREQAKVGNLDDPAWEESTAKLNQALDDEPYNAAVYHSLGMANMVRAGLFWEKYQRSHLDKSSYQEADRYYRDAINYFKKALDLNPRVEHAYNTIARILLDRLGDLKRKGDTEEFENLMAEVHQLLEECDHMVPVDKQVMLQVMKSRWDNMRGNTLKAKGQYRGLLEKNPKNHSVSYLLAALLMDDKTISSLGEAEDVIERALAEGKRSKGFYKLRYRIAERLYPFDYPKLETLLKGIVEINPEDPYLIFKYAVACFKNENCSLSDQYFKISEKLRFGDPLRFELHDYIWEKTGDPDKLKQIWEGKYNQTMLQIFEGNVQTVSYRRGYIIMDVSGERLFFSPLRVVKDESFQEGQRVRFNIAFNYIGARAINVEGI